MKHVPPKGAPIKYTYYYTEKGRAQSAQDEFNDAIRRLCYDGKLDAVIEFLRIRGERGESFSFDVGQFLAALLSGLETPAGGVTWEADVELDEDGNHIKLIKRTKPERHGPFVVNVSVKLKKAQASFVRSSF